MKIVLPCWGLGNVMFQYAFLCELYARNKEACCFFLHKRLPFEHNGYELDKLFKINPYKGLNLFQKVYVHTVEWIASLGLPHFKFISLFFKEIRVPENFIYYEDVFQHKGNCYFRGTWQSPRYFLHAKQEVIDTFRFDRSMLSPYAVKMAAQIEDCPNSVGLHIRRGDYLKSDFNGGLIKCCPLEYYERAIKYMCGQMDEPHFFVFSDDMEYAKENIKADNLVFVDGNRGKDSWQDMFLMSCCHHNIIANSTFSWWGAFLNPHADKIVIAPQRWWYYFEKDDVVPEEWIKM